MTAPLIAMPGGWEWIVILLIVVLIFGAKKLPDLARGTGRALRIFKAETKGLIDDDDDESTKDDASRAPGELNAPERRADTDALKSEHRPDATS